jgi:hypothetical protein
VKTPLSLLALVAALAVPTLALAQQPGSSAAAGAPPASATPAGGTQQGGVITLAEVTITGRIQKPIAAVDVSRIQPKLTLAELRQPFLDRIEKAVYKDPF